MYQINLLDSSWTIFCEQNSIGKPHFRFINLLYDDPDFTPSRSLSKFMSKFIKVRWSWAEARNNKILFYWHGLSKLLIREWGLANKRILGSIGFFYRMETKVLRINSCRNLNRKISCLTSCRLLGCTILGRASHTSGDLLTFSLVVIFHSYVLSGIYLYDIWYIRALPTQP